VVDIFHDEAYGTDGQSSQRSKVWLAEKRLLLAHSRSYSADSAIARDPTVTFIRYADHVIRGQTLSRRNFAPLLI